MKNVYLFIGILIISVIFSGCSTIQNAISEDHQDNYDFREVRWGYSQERVEIIEQGKRAFFRTQNLLIYKALVDHVPILIVYSFRNNKLRSAGYMTQKPSKNAQNLMDKYIEKLGIPKYELTDGMMWELPKSIVYVDGYSSHTRSRNQSFQQSSGVLEFILKEQPEEDSDLILRWDGVLTYIDINFYKELAETDFPLMNLSYYEKRLFGILKRRATMRVRTQTGDTVDIPLQENDDR